MQTTLTDVADPELDKAIDRGLEDHGARLGYPAIHDPVLYVHARGADGAPVGGIRGNTCHGWFHIWQFWLSEAHRGQGLGTRILQIAETEAVRRGCYSAHLETFDFQGLGFYEARGFETFGVIEAYFHGRDLHHMKKRMVP